MPKFSRDKGQREERSLVNVHKSWGVEAVRVPLSGAAEGFKHDVIAAGLSFECELRANGFKKIYDWLTGGDNPPDVLTIRADNKERLYVVTEKTWMTILKWKGLAK